MTTQSVRVTIPNVTLTLDQIVAAVRQLDEASMTEVAQAMLDASRDTRLSHLIRRLATRAPADDVTDKMIDEEIHAVRRSQRPHHAQGGH